MDTLHLPHPISAAASSRSLRQVVPRREAIPGHVILLICGFLGLSGCGEGDKGQTEAGAAQAPKETGRPETKKVQAADAVGYDGDALRQSLDKMLDKNDEKKKELDEAMKEGGQ